MVLSGTTAKTCTDVQRVLQESLSLDDFAHHEVTGAVEACPAGHAPLRVTRDETTHTPVVEMPARHVCVVPAAKALPQATDSRRTRGEKVPGFVPIG